MNRMISIKNTIGFGLRVFKQNSGINYVKE